jgi:hypothetical protein
VAQACDPCPAIAKVGGKKEVTGRNDIEIEISNQRSRLMTAVGLDHRLWA